MAEKFEFGGEIAWRPSPATIKRAHLTQFMARHGLSSYAELMERSTADAAWFTQAVLDYLDVQFQAPYTTVLDLSRGPAWPDWCVGARLNIVINCLDKYLSEPVQAARPAIIWEGEEGQTRTLTYAELQAEVAGAAHWLRSLGFGKGDALGLLMPMMPETVIAFLAIIRIGGIVLPLFSGYGASAIVSRLNDAEARGLVTADGFFRRGQLVPLKPTADEAAQQVPSLRAMVVVKRAGNAVDMLPGRDFAWPGTNVPAAAGEVESARAMPQVTAGGEPEPTSAEDPLMVIYTSGTTGRPKGAVHTHCGFPVKAAQDMAFGTDVHAGDRIYWVTDMGWMMGPWLVFGSLLLGATMVLYDGAPDYPGPDRLWAMVDRHAITHLGISPTLVRALIRHGETPVRAHSLASLRILASTGEPWNPDPWRWLFEVVGRSQVPIINYSGGTEIGGGILMGNPLLPLKPCAFSAACPGMAADVVDEAGKPVRGQVGELVVRQPWIGMTRGFWRDSERYEATYWSRFPGLWVHGDFAAVDADGQWYILGRSDDTIKVAGKRLGPAEVESVVVNHPAVIEAAAIGVPDAVKGSELVVFCVLGPGQAPSDSLGRELKHKVAAELGKPLQPSAVQFVRDLPKTRNAKVMRRIVRAAYLGEPLGDTSSLENPEAVEGIRKSAEKRANE